MPSFSQHSLDRLATCHEDIQRVMHELIRHFDFTVLEGHRSGERQEELFRQGKTKARAGESLHNTNPSRAIDIAPWPVDWEDRERFVYLAGWVMATAAQMGVKLRWGNDWDQDTELSDNRFDDLPHFELID